MGLNWLGKVLIAAFVLQLATNAGRQPLDLDSICDIQGSGFTPPYLGQTVSLRGVVFADLDETYRRGFFIQEENCDSSPNTSDGIFIYLGERLQVVNVGDLVEVSGTVQEYYGMTEILASPLNVTVLSSGHPLPTPQEMSPPFANNQSRYYFETLEGMYVALGDGLTVGPTDADSRTWLVRADLGIPRVMQDDPAGTGEVICVDDRGLFAVTPEVKVGDHVQGLLGAMDYSFGQYCLDLTVVPLVQPSQATASSEALDPRLALDALDFSVATFNLANLFDPYDDPITEDDVLSLTEYRRRMNKRALAIHDGLGEPAMIAVQEVENQLVLQTLAGWSTIYAEYGALLVDGPDRRGLDIGLLYRIDQVQIIEYQVRQGCTTLIDGLGPDGNLDVINPQNAITCDSDGDQILDGNRLSSRPPLVVHLNACQPECGAVNASTTEVWMIINHWKSKVEDTATIQYTLPRRLQEAEFVTGLVQEILAGDPQASLIVLGDLNDYPNSQPLATLTNQGLVDLTGFLGRLDRYTYNYHGISQVLDYILVHPSLALAPATVSALHVNADYPYGYMGDAYTVHRSSDHDLLMTQFIQGENLLYLPVIFR